MKKELALSAMLALSGCVTLPEKEPPKIVCEESEGLELEGTYYEDPDWCIIERAVHRIKEECKKITICTK